VEDSSFWGVVFDLVVAAVYFLGCFGVANYFHGKGQSYAIGLLISVFLTPLIGVIVAVVVPPNAEVLAARGLSSGNSKRCPQCAEVIQSAAKKCRYCGSVVDSGDGSAG